MSRTKQIKKVEETWIPQEYIDDNGHHWIEISSGNWHLLYQHLELKESCNSLNEKEKKQLETFRNGS